MVDSYLISQKEGEDVNTFLYRLGQLPVNWIYKGMQHKRDAFIFYKICDRERKFLYKAIKKEGVNYSYVRSGEMVYALEKVLDANPKRFLPDYEAFYYLTHLAIENFLKGIWLQKNKEKIGFIELPKTIKSHNLIYLCGLIKFDLSQSEKELLLKLQKNFVSYGRYPVDLEAKPQKDPGFKDLEIGSRDLNGVLYDCISNPYKAEKAAIDNILKKMAPFIKQVFDEQSAAIEAAFV